MSSETAILLAIKELSTAQAERIAALERQVKLLAERLPGMPDYLSTREAVRYTGRSKTTLHRWRDEGLLVKRTGRLPWSRVELDHCLAGAPINTETRGRRRAA